MLEQGAGDRWGKSGRAHLKYFVSLLLKLDFWIFLYSFKWITAWAGRKAFLTSPEEYRSEKCVLSPKCFILLVFPSNLTFYLETSRFEHEKSVCESWSWPQLLCKNCCIFQQWLRAPFLKFSSSFEKKKENCGCPATSHLFFQEGKKTLILHPNSTGFQQQWLSLSRANDILLYLWKLRPPGIRAITTSKQA